MKRLMNFRWWLAAVALAYTRVALAQAGFVDTSFLNGMSGPNSWVWALALQQDGKLLVGGQFTSFDGLPGGEVVRLNPDGSIDPNFPAVIAGGGATVNSLAVQPDGKIIVGGMFSGINGATRVNIARLNADGSVDSNFVAQATGGSFVARLDWRLRLAHYRRQGGMSDDTGNASKESRWDAVFHTGRD